MQLDRLSYWMQPIEIEEVYRYIAIVDDILISKSAVVIISYHLNNNINLQRELDAAQLVMLHAHNTWYTDTNNPSIAWTSKCRALTPET
jgi:hypothetical protein